MTGRVVGWIEAKLGTSGSSMTKKGGLDSFFYESRAIVAGSFQL